MIYKFGKILIDFRQYILLNISYKIKISALSFPFILVLPAFINAQTTSYNQFWNEIQFARPISKKWSSEINIGSTFSSTDSSNRIFQNNIQRMGRVCFHYYFSPRWKFSSYLAYYHNKDVPEIGQYESPEYRLSLQGLYYIHKIAYTLTTQMRGELRYIRNKDGNFEDVYRYRQNIKFLKPLNSKMLRKGVYYFLAIDEIFVKSEAKTTGVTFFDRNQLTIGGGYMLTDDLQLELAYVNEFMPRDDYNMLTNAVSLTITFNNLLPRIRKMILPSLGGKELSD